jgi:hypothetical protein
MIIHSIELITSMMLHFDPEEEGFEEKIRSKVMSYFNNNQIIDAIATAEIVMSPVYVSFRFQKPIVIKDEA